MAHRYHRPILSRMGSLRCNNRRRRKLSYLRNSNNSSSSSPHRRRNSLLSLHSSSSKRTSITDRKVHRLRNSRHRGRPLRFLLRRTSRSGYSWVRLHSISAD